MKNDITSVAPDNPAPSCCGQQMKNDKTTTRLSAEQEKLLVVLAEEARGWTLSELRHAAAFWRKGPACNVQAQACAEVVEGELARRTLLEQAKPIGMDEGLQRAIEQDWPE